MYEISKILCPHRRLMKYQNEHEKYQYSLGLSWKGLSIQSIDSSAIPKDITSFSGQTKTVTVKLTLGEPADNQITIDFDEIATVEAGTTLIILVEEGEVGSNPGTKGKTIIRFDDAIDYQIGLPT